MNGRALIVDDEIDICDLIELNLKNSSFKHIKTANDGKLAVEIAKERNIVLDLTLPEIDGLSVCKTLKQDKTTVIFPLLYSPQEAEI